RVDTFLRIGLIDVSAVVIHEEDVAVGIAANTLWRADGNRAWSNTGGCRRSLPRKAVRVASLQRGIRCVGKRQRRSDAGIDYLDARIGRISVIDVAVGIL